MVLNYGNNLHKSSEFGKWLAHPQYGEEVIISGLAGSYPNSDNVYEFFDNLLNKVDMTTNDERRWKRGNPEIPQSIGKLNIINKFDAGYFGLNINEVNQMDPLARMFMEKSVEAIFDAGLNPKQLEGTKTAVYFAICFPEPANYFLNNRIKEQYLTITGHLRSMFTNRLSYHLKLNGICCTLDTACSSSLYAIEHAYKAIRTGQCDMAIVGAGSICLHPLISLQFACLQVLSCNGPCNPFDKSADGFIRSEACVALLLQKGKNCRRNYAEIVHMKSNDDGFKEQGILFPSKEMQTVLLKEFYHECEVDIHKINFVEAHGTATKVGDLQEVAALDEAICKWRKTPLAIGSTKSNMGHSEGASGISSVSKILIGMEKNIILPNIHFKQPRQDIEALNEGRVHVVNEIIPIINDEFLAAVNNFGFGGANCHSLLRRNKKNKIKQGLPLDNLPRLVCVSGREKNSIISILNDIKKRPLDAEYISLYHEIFSKNVNNHLYRGYLILNKSGELMRSLKFFNPSQKGFYIVFSSFLNSWRQIFGDLILLPLVSQSVQKIHDTLSSHGILIMEIIMNGNRQSIFDEIIGSMAVQIILSDIIKILKIEPNDYFGYGLGKLICGYMDGSVNLKKLVLIFYKFAKRFENIDQQVLINSEKVESLAMYLWYLDIKSSTDIEALNCSKLHLNEVVKRNDVIWDIGDGIILEINTNINNYSNYFNFKPESKTNYFLTILQKLGSLYEFGYNFELTKLYPAIEYPVSRGTPMISPLIKWNHSNDWFVHSYKSVPGSTNEYLLKCSIKNDKWRFLTDHVIDGRNIFPATGYFDILYEGFTSINRIGKGDMPLIIENCKFLRATNIPKEGDLQFNVRVQNVSGKFEILEGDTVVSEGVISLSKNEFDEPICLPVSEYLEENLNMKTEDVYKEFRLRGYNYNDSLKRIMSCNSDLNKAYVRWDGNWIIFMDNMLQLKILQADTRQLYIPISIEHCLIDFKKHLSYVQSFREKEPNLPVYIYKDLNIVKCGGIELRNISFAPINRRKAKEPLLEYFDFVSNQTELTLEDSIRVNMQLIIENNNISSIKCVEICDNEITNKLDILSAIIYKALNDVPEIISQIIILSKNKFFENLNFSEFKVENKDLSDERNCDLIIIRHLFGQTEMLPEVFVALKENGFILTREPLSCQVDFLYRNDIQCLTEFKTENEKFLLLRRKFEFKLPIFIEVSNKKFNWISKLQKAMKDDLNTVIFAQNEPFNGILGLINCIRREPGGNKVKCVFIQDKAPPFDLDNIFYYEQLKKNLVINVYKNSEWGTYRHLILNKATDVVKEHFYVRGGLENFKLVEGSLQSKSILSAEQELIHVYYSALNFRDVMVATGRLHGDVISTDRLKHECILGFEYSGRNSLGKRFMGITNNGALSTLIKGDKYLMWVVPDKWSLEEAATVPIEHNLKTHETVLIHSGAGGIGQAAIQVALHHGCLVYTTVGTKEKKEFLKRRFPQLTDKHIGNSRDTSFEQMIYIQTNGRGVDLVLNSLSEEKLLASVRCLAKGGKFFEIGKFDFSSNNPLRLMFLQRNASFHGITVDKYFTANPSHKQKIHNLLTKFLHEGYVKPINTNIFNIDKVEQAFRYMITGKHIGKTLIKIRDAESEKIIPPKILLRKGNPQYLCDPNVSYIIVGGLGGFGLELADWLVLRGARNLILSSRRGLSNGYQSYRINLWKSYGCHIKISMSNVMTKNGCKQLIEESIKLAPVAAIFNLAGTLKDALFENQTIENFMSTFHAKVLSTKYLDKTSRDLCTNLKDFVVFSSTFAGFGNAGQTNYAMGNSVMERICEKRRKDGLPGIAIEWGPIDEVGLVANKFNGNVETEICGRLQQKISNCLEVLDVLLNHKFTILSSVVLADKIKRSKLSIVDTVANILGIRDLKTISIYLTLAELGMDSLSSMEIKKTLEGAFEIFLTAIELRKLTFAKLIAIEKGKLPFKPKTEIETKSVELFLKIIDNEETSKLSIVEHKTKIADIVNAPYVIFLPGTEGSAKVLEPLTKNLHVRAFVLQFTFDNCENSLNELASSLLRHVKKNLSKTKPFNIVAYSYGTVIATELVSLLEKEGYCPGHLVCLDGSFKVISEFLRKQFNIEDERNFQTLLSCYFLEFFLSPECVSKKKGEILNANTWEERLDITLNAFPKNLHSNLNFYRNCIIGMYKRLGFLKTYKVNFPKLKSKITLFKPEEQILKEAEYDYCLSQICENPIEVQIIKGNHITILENLEMAKAIDQLFMDNETFFKSTTNVEALVSNILDEDKRI